LVLQPRIVTRRAGDAVDPVGEPLLVAQHQEDERRESERDESEIVVLHPQRRIAEPPPDRKTQKARGEECQEKRHAQRHQQRNGISADADEGALRERDLPGITECEIKADRRDGQDRPGRDEENAVGLEEKRRDDCRNGSERDDHDAEARHTVRSSSRPSRPCGRSRITAIKMISGNAPRYCEEM
jgi:hypothetical protein